MVWPGGPNLTAVLAPGNSDHSKRPEGCQRQAILHRSGLPAGRSGRTGTPRIDHTETGLGIKCETDILPAMAASHRKNEVSPA
jgi:hypothetical protein